MREVMPPDLSPAAGPDAGSAPGRSPGPSRAVYRITRVWKKAWVRRLALVILPGALALGAAGHFLSDPGVASAIAAQRDALVAAVIDRPEFAVRGLRVFGGSEDLEAAVAETVAVPPGASTLTFDVAAVQAAVTALPAVESARVTLGPDGMLEIRVRERLARALWRDGEDRLWRIDRHGVAVGRAMTRAGYPAMPLVIGDGAPDAVAEALAILAAVPDLRPRVRALVRVGGRRWNVVLDRDLTIMLPEDAPEAALSRVMAWHYGDEVLDRGLAVIDMRLPSRPTLRMSPAAREILRLRDAAGDGSGEET